MVKYSNLAAKGFREIDLEASYVFVRERDSAGYSAYFKSKDTILRCKKYKFKIFFFRNLTFAVSGYKK